MSQGKTLETLITFSGHARQTLVRGILVDEQHRSHRHNLQMSEMWYNRHSGATLDYAGDQVPKLRVPGPEEESTPSGQASQVRLIFQHLLFRKVMKKLK